MQKIWIIGFFFEHRLIWSLLLPVTKVTSVYMVTTFTFVTKVTSFHMTTTVTMGAVVTSFEVPVLTKVKM